MRTDTFGFAVLTKFTLNIQVSPSTLMGHGQPYRHASGFLLGLTPPLPHPTLSLPLTYW